MKIFRPHRHAKNQIWHDFTPLLIPLALFIALAIFIEWLCSLPDHGKAKPDSRQAATEQREPTVYTPANSRAGKGPIRPLTDAEWSEIYALELTSKCTAAGNCEPEQELDRDEIMRYVVQGQGASDPLHQAIVTDLYKAGILDTKRGHGALSEFTAYRRGVRVIPAIYEVPLMPQPTAEPKPTTAPTGLPTQPTEPPVAISEPAPLWLLIAGIGGLYIQRKGDFNVYKILSSYSLKSRG